MNDAFITIVSLSVSGSILALILFAGKPLMKYRVSKAFYYYIWLLVLLRLVVPVAAPMNVMGSLFGIEQPSMNSTMTEQTGIPAGNEIVQVDGQATSYLNTQSVPLKSQNHKTTDIQWLFIIWNLIKNNFLWIWLVGSVVNLGWFITAYAYFSQRIRHSCVTPHSDDLAIFEQECEDKHVHMACSSRVATPMFIGVLDPLIVLPQIAYVRNGMGRELMNILRHELTHYRRKDVLYKWMVVAVTSLHWFNPLMLFIRKEISRACELSCDEVVISGMSEDEKQSYGNTLIALSANRKLSADILATTLCEDKKELKERLVSIMKYKKKSALAVVLTLVLMLLLAGCAAMLGAVNPKTTSENTAAESSSSTAKPVKPDTNHNGSNISSASISSDMKPKTDSQTASTNSRPQITDSVDTKWKEKYNDININNEWISEQHNIIALFGSLKSDPQQGVIEVIFMDDSGNNTISLEKRYLSPVKHGALKVSELGAKDFTLIVTDKDGFKWNFQIYNGFNPDTPLR